MLGRMAVDLLICVASEIEGDRIAGALDPEGRCAGRSVALVRTGVGPVNAAHAATLFLARRRARTVVVCGIGGAYPGSGLEPGDVVSARTETYGDLGAGSPGGFLDMESLDLPVVAGPPPLYNRLPLDIYPTARVVDFVTCSTCTGTDEAARAIAERTGGAVESMEGAAVVHVARLHALPVGEVRGISNAVGDRNRAGWRVREAADAAQRALLAWLEGGAC
jgi:futalosine hydrolase